MSDQAPLTEDVAVRSAADRSFEQRIERLGEEFGVAVEADEIVSHDTKHAIVNLAEGRSVDAIVAEHEPLRLRGALADDDPSFAPATRTTVTAYLKESRRPPLHRRLLERDLR